MKAIWAPNGTDKPEPAQKYDDSKQKLDSPELHSNDPKLRKQLEATRRDPRR